MKINFIVPIALLIASCNTNASKTETASQADSTDAKTALPHYAYPVEMAHWKMGDPQNTKIILDMYRAWDDNNPAAVASFYADSARMDLPGGTRITLGNKDIYAYLKKARALYGATYNQIISAYALHNEDKNGDWVMVMTYNKWEYDDGSKDSTLYLDNWRVKDGKIVYLNSLEQTPSKAMLKRLEKK